MNLKNPSGCFLDHKRMIKSTAHVDIGNQIDNSWKKDSALAIKMNLVGFSIKIREPHKRIIRKKFIKDAMGDSKISRKNRRVAAILHSYLLFKLLSAYHEICDVVFVCNDLGNFSYINKYYSKICKYYDSKPNVIIKPKKGKKKSKAHHLANKVFKGQRSEDILIKSSDIAEIIELIEGFL